jgi:nucleoid DNA-binding protein
METVKQSMVAGNNVYLRGFGSFIVKKRARKLQEIYQRTNYYYSCSQYSGF